MIDTVANFDTTFEQRLAKLDLKRVMAHIQDEVGLSIRDLGRAEEQYRQFLTLVQMYPNMRINPPKLADLVWHTHMIHSRQYMTDCDMLFGDYFHHEPGSEPTQFQAEIIYGLYEKHFSVNPALYGLDNPVYRGIASCD